MTAQLKKVNTTVRRQ
ncbi:hypothetical protein LINGRAHAP2_LOCUS28981 [Linum grandiflorum]